jgi:hypothetical protein
VTALWGSLLRRGMRMGFDRGVLEGRPPWLVLGALALLAHLAGRAMQRQPDVVIRADLERDAMYEISEVKP